jgi:hypothetical protein
MRRIALILSVALLVAACQPNNDVVIPTLRVLSSATPLPTLTYTPIATDTEAPTDTPVPTATYTETEIPTETFTPSNTPTPSRTPIPSATVNATNVAIGTSTAQVIEAPVFSTFTPPPPGIIVAVRPTSTGTPQVVADVIITQSQYQEEVNRLLADNPDVSQAEVVLAEEGVFVNLSATGGDAFATGRFLIRFDLSTGIGGNSFNNIVVIQPVAPLEFEMQGSGLPSEAFVGIAYGDVTEAVFEAFNAILNQRLGEGNHNLEFITLENGRMLISLLVPEPAE